MNGGPAGLVYGFIIAWIGGTLQALVMAEMASMYVQCRSFRLYQFSQHIRTGHELNRRLRRVTDSSREKRSPNDFEDPQQIIQIDCLIPLTLY